MGLTAHDMSDMGRLAQLAMNPQSGASREEIYLAVASLYRIQGAGLNTRERELMREILRRLTRDVEMAIRIALAQRLAEDSTAPHDLILLLVDDTIEVARPLILNSPLLTESDVLKLIAEAGVGHQEAVAGRAQYRRSGHRRPGQVAGMTRCCWRWSRMSPPGSPPAPMRPWCRSPAL